MIQIHERHLIFNYLCPLFIILYALFIIRIIIYVNLIFLYVYHSLKPISFSN
jgi:hypothetical protein